MADIKKGKLTQIIGAVLDIKFTDGLPEINEAIKIDTKDSGVLVTYPVKADYLFVSKLVVYLIDAIKNSFVLFVPILFGCKVVLIILFVINFRH